MHLLQLGFRADHVVAVNNGVDPMFHPGGTRSASPLVLSVARLAPVKRQDELIEAAVIARQRVPDLRLVIVGEGPLRPALEARIAAHGAGEWITMAGRLNHAELVAEYQRAWLVSSTSLAEGWGLALTEAAACGTPAVATDVSGHRSSVIDGVTGVLVPLPRIAETMADVLLDDARREQAGVCRARPRSRPHVGCVGAGNPRGVAGPGTPPPVGRYLGSSLVATLSARNAPLLGDRSVVRASGLIRAGTIADEPVVAVGEHLFVRPFRLPTESVANVIDIEPQRLRVHHPVIRRERCEVSEGGRFHQGGGRFGRQRPDPRPGAGMRAQRLQRLAHRAEAVGAGVEYRRAGDVGGEHAHIGEIVGVNELYRLSPEPRTKMSAPSATHSNRMPKMPRRPWPRIVRGRMMVTSRPFDAASRHARSAASLARPYASIGAGTVEGSTGLLVRHAEHCT